MKISRLKVDRREVIRFEFRDNSEIENMASNVLTDFIFSLVSDDREFGFGRTEGANYVDIPTKEFRATTKRIQLHEAAAEMGRKGGRASRRTLDSETARAMAKKRHAKREP